MASDILSDVVGPLFGPWLVDVLVVRVTQLVSNQTNDIRSR